MMLENKKERLQEKCENIFIAKRDKYVTMSTFLVYCFIFDFKIRLNSFIFARHTLKTDFRAVKRKRAMRLKIMYPDKN